MTLKTLVDDITAAHVNEAIAEIDKRQISKTDAPQNGVFS